MSIYCGNNRNDPKLIHGGYTIGTNYDCLRKGIGLGRGMPYDPRYSNEYNPIDKRKFYCGKSKVLPKKGYFANGSPSICLRKGVGIGKAQRASQESKDDSGVSLNFANSYNKPYNYFKLIPLFIFIITMLLLYITKPRIITKYSEDCNKRVIDKKKFTILTFIIGIFLLVVQLYI